MTITQHAARLPVRKVAPDFMQAMLEFSRASSRQAQKVGLSSELCELVKIRASQINGCGYCVDLHVRDALRAGVDNRKLHNIAVWHESPLFDDRERAALQFAEAVTKLTNARVQDEDWNTAAQHFSPEELSGLIAVLVAINSWNRIGVSTQSFEFPE